tara:strand:- start:4785 stop:5936 length:1152 start_codon:yes stop_codon:yes gene_type:complete
MKILLYGATGTIGDSVFKIVKENQEKLRVVAATCNTNYKKLEKLKIKYNIEKLGINNHKSAEKYKSLYCTSNKKLVIGNENFLKLITSDIDVIILAISGLSALNISYDIAKSGKIFGLANKECIISIGPRLISLAKKNKTKIIPLDSEHNSIYRLLESNKKKFKSITITASGGPFFNKKLSYLRNVTPNQAIKHPIWKMGKKISVDSATMVNKALEIIEAKYLFDLSSDQINAIIHPESIVHAAINFNDNSSISLLNKPDMRIPISYLFNLNNNSKEKENIFQQLNRKSLTFHKISHNKFPAIRLAYKVLEIGGLAPHIFNYNNEVLVNLFLQKKIRFLDIVKYNEITLMKFLESNKNIFQPNLKDINNTSIWINKNIFLGKI